MKTIIWGAFGVLALLWTGGVALVVELLQWSAGALASGGVTGLAEAAARVPVPTWLAPFVDLAGWREILSSVAIALESLSTILPPLGESLGWIVPVIWVIWGLGLLALAVLTILASRLIRF